MNSEAIETTVSPEFDPLATTGGHAERLARGVLLQQSAQVIRLAGGLAVVTVLARQLTLAELGTYTILLSLITYVTFMKSSVMNAAVVGVARAAGSRNRRQLDGVVSTALVIYLSIGVLSALALCAIGLSVLPALNIPRGLYGAAQIGVVGLSVMTLISWPLQIFDDLLRGLQRYGAVSALEIFAMVVYVAGAMALVFSGAPVWALVTWNAAIPLLMGLACLAALPFLGVPVSVATRHVTRGEARRFASFSGLLVVQGVADLAMYSLDRFILSALRSPATVGLYEGPLGAQNMIRYLNGVLSAPVVPAATDFLARGDNARLQLLFRRGLRYTLAITMPFVVVMVVAAGPILRVWLGPRFVAAAHPAALFAGWWLIGANGGLIVTLLIAAGRLRQLTVLSWTGAAVNVALTLSLTARIGIYGPIVGAISAYGVMTCFALPLTVRVTGVRWRDLARDAWVPCYTTAAALAAALLVLRHFVVLSGLPAVAGTILASAAAFWGAYWVIWLAPDERALALRALRLRRG